jgi:ankyrin repeat protein
VLAQVKAADRSHAAREFKAQEDKVQQDLCITFLGLTTIPLSRAVQITKLLSANADPTVHGDDRETLLHYAAYYGATNLMTSLIDHGAGMSTNCPQLLCHTHQWCVLCQM